MKRVLSICAIIAVANAGVDSVNIDENGNIKLKAVAEDVMRIGDARDKQSCFKKAELKAKADIAKFFKEQITSKEVIDELSQQAEKTQISNNSESDNINRDVVINEATHIQNNAEAALRGLVVIEKVASIENKECSVTIGFNSKTLKAAETINKAMQQSIAKDSQATKQKDKAMQNNNNSSNNGGVIEKVKNSTKRSSMYDEF